MKEFENAENVNQTKEFCRKKTLMRSQCPDCCHVHMSIKMAPWRSAEKTFNNLTFRSFLIL
jgi:hypothetical protein